MTMYLRREEKHFPINEYAKENAPTTNLLDRFFMIYFKIPLEVYEKKTATLEELDEFLVEYFKIFIENPEKGSIVKFMKYMSKSEKEIALKDFTQEMRAYFPNSIRYLKDFYGLKFKKQEKHSLLLRNFNSRILRNDAILLALKLPRLTAP